MTIGTGVDDSTAITVNDGANSLLTFNAGITVNLKGNIVKTEKSKVVGICTAGNPITINAKISISGTMPATNSAGLFVCNWTSVAVGNWNYYFDFEGVNGTNFVFTSDAGKTIATMFYGNRTAGNFTNYVILKYISDTCPIKHTDFFRDEGGLRTNLNYIDTNNFTVKPDYFWRKNYNTNAGYIFTWSNLNIYANISVLTLAPNTSGSLPPITLSPFVGSTFTNCKFMNNNSTNYTILFGGITGVYGFGLATTSNPTFTNCSLINLGTRGCYYESGGSGLANPTAYGDTFDWFTIYFINCSFVSNTISTTKIFNVIRTSPLKYFLKDCNGITSSDILQVSSGSNNGVGFVRLLKKIQPTIKDSSSVNLSGVDILAITGYQDATTLLPYDSCGDSTLASGKPNDMYLGIGQTKYSDGTWTTWVDSGGKAQIEIAKTGYNQYSRDLAIWTDLGTPYENDLTSFGKTQFFGATTWNAGIKSASLGNYEVESYTDGLLVFSSGLFNASRYNDNFTYPDADAVTWKWIQGRKYGDGTLVAETGTASGDINTTTPGAMRGSALYSGGTTGLFARTINLKMSAAGTLDIICRINGSVSDSTDAIGIGVWQDATHYVWVGRRNNAGASNICHAQCNGGAESRALVASADNHIWVRILRNSSNIFFTYYSLDESIIPPTSWTNITNTGGYWGGNYYTSVFCYDSAATGSAVTADFYNFYVSDGTIVAGEVSYKSTGNWTSASQSAITDGLINSITFNGYFDTNNYIDKVEILKASDDTVLSTCTTNITSDNTSLLTGDFDNGLSVCTVPWKIKIYMVGTDTTTPKLGNIIVDKDEPIYLRLASEGAGGQVWGIQVLQ